MYRVAFGFLLCHLRNAIAKRYSLFKSAKGRKLTRTTIKSNPRISHIQISRNIVPRNLHPNQLRPPLSPRPTPHRPAQAHHSPPASPRTMREQTELFKRKDHGKIGTTNRSSDLCEAPKQSAPVRPLSTHPRDYPNIIMCN